jgi:hypothetical protein
MGLAILNWYFSNKEHRAVNTIGVLTLCAVNEICIQSTSVVASGAVNSTLLILHAVLR